MLVRYESHKYKRKTDKEFSEKGQEYFDSLKTDNDKYHIEPMAQVFKKRRIFKCAGNTVFQNEYDINILNLCMAVISDGYMIFKNGKFGGVGFNLSKKRDIEKLEEILKNGKFKHTKRYSKNHEKQGSYGVYNYYINSKESREVYEIIGKDKKIPKWFLSLKSEILKELVTTYAMFDGSFDNRENCENFAIYSIDEENIDTL
jgi:hypothetical protein